MTPRFILFTTAAILLAACDRRSAEAEAARIAAIAAQQQKEQAANDKIQQLEDRLNAADKQKAADREAELARVKAELAQVKKEKENAAERIRDLQNESPAPIAEAPAQNGAINADLQQTADEEDREPVYTGRVVPETQYVSSVQSFYEPLDSSGDWIQTDDYGYVFRPQVAARAGWRPYTDGHWIHTGYGWTWQSNEEFGWATYHYGRWTHIPGTGWVWIPGHEWGPAWVSWRRGNEHCGWAPLPPESQAQFNFTASVDRDYDIGPAAYVFIALANFGARSYAPVVVPPQQNVTIISKTVNITNVTYNGSGAKNAVVYNGGPSYELMRARSKEPVENVTVNFAPQSAAGNQAKFANVRQGNTFQVAAPPAAVAATTKPVKIAAQLGKPKHDHGWEGVDPSQEQQLKKTIAATSTARPKNLRAAPNATPPTAPVTVAPQPAKIPQATPKPEIVTRPAIVEKPHQPETSAPKIPVIPELPPKVDRSEEPKKSGENEPRRVRQIEPVATPNPVRENPVHPPTTPVERVHPTPEPAEHRKIAPIPEKAPATPVPKPFVENPKPPVERVAPQREPEKMREAEPKVNRAEAEERAHEKVQRPQEPVPNVQRPVQPQPAQQKKGGEENDKKKKKDEQ